jgi:hypothetical protein
MALGPDPTPAAPPPRRRREVIGLLAGTWDDESKLLRVERALPVRELQAGPRRFAVEMAAESVQDAFNLVERVWKMQVGSPWAGGGPGAGWGLALLELMHGGWHCA